MAYNPAPGRLHLGDQAAARDWFLAPVGKWFVGIIDTQTGAVFIAPKNVHYTVRNRTGFKEGVRNNESPRGMNRYASGAVGDRDLSDNTPYELYRNGDFLHREEGIAVHMSICEHYGLDPFGCVGFTIIKLSPHNFAQLKFGSRALHAFVPGSRQFDNLSLRTFNKTKEFSPGTAQMPRQWQDALISWLRVSELFIIRVAASQE